MPGGIEAEPEGVHLAVGVLLDVAAVERETIGVAGIHPHLAAVARPHAAVVVVTVRGIEPAVEPASKRRLVAVRIAFPTEWPVKKLLLVRLDVDVRERNVALGVVLTGRRRIGSSVLSEDLDACLPHRVLLPAVYDGRGGLREPLL